MIQPYTAADAKGLLKAAIRDPNPVVFLENEILYGHTFEVPKIDDYVLPIGKAKIVRAGKDVTIISFGIGMTYATKAADELAGMGIEAEVIDLRTLRPMDLDTVIASVRKTNRCVTVEEGWPVASIGSYIASEITMKAFDYLDAPAITVTGKARWSRPRCLPLPRAPPRRHRTRAMRRAAPVFATSTSAP